MPDARFFDIIASYGSRAARPRPARSRRQHRLPHNFGVGSAGASIPATVCFAAGAVAGGVSAGGHLADTAHLGTATTATVVLDVAQIVAPSLPSAR